MGLLDWLGLSRKESAFSQAIVSQFAGGQAIWTPENYEAFAREGYRISPYVFACVDQLARGAAGVPWVLYQVKKGRNEKAMGRQLANMAPLRRADEMKRLLRKGEITELEDHRLLRVLAKPNDQYGGAALIESLIAYRMIAGNAYTEMVSASNGVPVELYSHRPDRMKVVVGDAVRPIAGYEYQVAGALRRIDAADMHHWRTFNPLSDWYGMPPLLAAARSVDMNNAARKWNVSLLQNSARPSGILNVKGANASKDPVMKKFIEELKTWAGSKNAGKAVVLGSPQGVDVTWQQTAFTPNEICWHEGTKLSGREVCIVFRVPSILCGDVEASTFANWEHARKALYLEGIFPLLDLLRDDWNAGLVPRFGDGLLLGYDADGVDAVQEERAQVHERTRKAWLAGEITLNEARRALGYEDDPIHGEKYAWEVIPKLAGTTGSGHGEGGAGNGAAA